MAQFKDINGFAIDFTEVLYIVGNKVCRAKTAFMGNDGLYEVDDVTACRVRNYIAGEEIAQLAGDERGEYTGNSRETRFMMASLKDAREGKYTIARAAALRSAWNIAARKLANVACVGAADDCDGINGRPLTAK